MKHSALLLLLLCTLCSNACLDDVQQRPPSNDASPDSKDESTDSKDESTDSKDESKDDTSIDEGKDNTPDQTGGMPDCRDLIDAGVFIMPDGDDEARESCLRNKGAGNEEPNPTGIACTKAAPCATLSTVLNNTVELRSTIYIQDGAYEETGTIEMNNEFDVSIIGVDENWGPLNGENNRPIISLAQGSSSKTTMVITGEVTKNNQTTSRAVTLKNLVIQGPDLSLLAPAMGTHGYIAYTIKAENFTGGKTLILDNVHIVGGTGGNGADGAHAAEAMQLPVSATAGGQPGKTCNLLRENGGTGGTGGSCPGTNAENGQTIVRDDPSPANRDFVSAGGKPGTNACNPLSAASANCETEAMSATDKDGETKPINNTPSTPIPELLTRSAYFTSLGANNELEWIPQTYRTKDGEPGYAGGGGGGGRAALNRPGGNGGNGGGGGCPGKSGQPGNSGGASIALLLSGVNLSEEAFSVELGTSGNGGNGGNATSGTPGGSGSIGTTGQTCQAGLPSIPAAGNGAAGADGGRGGYGAAGPGGCSGDVFGIVLSNTPSMIPPNMMSNSGTLGTNGMSGVHADPAMPAPPSCNPPQQLDTRIVQ